MGVHTDADKTSRLYAPFQRFERLVERQINRARNVEFLPDQVQSDTDARIHAENAPDALCPDVEDPPGKLVDLLLRCCQTLLQDAKFGNCSDAFDDSQSAAVNAELERATLNTEEERLTLESRREAALDSVQQGLEDIGMDLHNSRNDSGYGSTDSQCQTSWRHMANDLQTAVRELSTLTARCGEVTMQKSILDELRKAKEQLQVASGNPETNRLSEKDVGEIRDIPTDATPEGPFLFSSTPVRDAQSMGQLSSSPGHVRQCRAPNTKNEIFPVTVSRLTRLDTGTSGVTRGISPSGTPHGSDEVSVSESGIPEQKTAAGVPAATGRKYSPRNSSPLDLERASDTLENSASYQGTTATCQYGHIEASQKLDGFENQRLRPVTRLCLDFESDDHLSCDSKVWPGLGYQKVWLLAIGIIFVLLFFIHQWCDPLTDLLIIASKDVTNYVLSLECPVDNEMTQRQLIQRLAAMFGRAVVITYTGQPIY